MASSLATCCRERRGCGWPPGSSRSCRCSSWSAASPTWRAGRRWSAAAAATSSTCRAGCRGCCGRCSSSRLAGTSAAARPLRGAAAADRAARQGHGPAAVVPRRLPGGRGPGTGYGAAAPALAAPGSRHAGLGALVALTGTGLFPPSMVGLPGDQSNMNPPTICIVALAIWQLALVMLARGRVSAWLARPRPWTAVIAVGSMAMTVYLWHLTAMVTVLGLVLAAHGPLPTPGGALWWATRPIWLALLAAALTPMALFLSRFEHPAAGAPPPPSGPRARLRPCRAAARGPPRAPPGRARQASASPRWGGSL